MRIISYFYCCLLFIVFIPSIAFSSNESTIRADDTTSVDNLNTLAYNSRLENSRLTYKYAQQALQAAKKIQYLNGIAEAYRMIGISEYYQNQSDIAIENYLRSISYFTRANNQHGIANVYNNIGNLYRDVDYNQGLEYFKKALVIAQKHNIQVLLGGLYLNIGTIYQKKRQYRLALSYYNKSEKLFTRLNNKDGLTLCKQNLSIVYYGLKQFRQAEKYGVEAIQTAKKYKMNYIVAGTNLTLSSTYLSLGDYTKAEATIKEGINYAKLLRDKKLESDFMHSSYELESKRRNYQKALGFLEKVYKQDSSFYRTNTSEKISFVEQRVRQREKQHETELIIERQKNNKLLLWASAAVAVLAFLIIFLLLTNVRKELKTNKQLHLLNNQLLRQKSYVDKINLQQENILNERTKELQIKNRKLSDYSSYLSHQIRGPIATIKGLMMLQRENLISDEELIEQIHICVEDIDDKIININQMLHDIKSKSIIK